LIYNSFCRNGRSEDYAAGLVYMAGLVRGLPAVPGLKKVTADASGFIALTPEGMAGTSQDLPAPETAVALRRTQYEHMFSGLPLIADVRSGT
jgi:hypothetical protein